MLVNTDSKKRYNLLITDGEGDKLEKLTNVCLKTIERGFVIVVDKDGKEHYYTGSVGICLDEI